MKQNNGLEFIATERRRLMNRTEELEAMIKNDITSIVAQANPTRDIQPRKRLMLKTVAVAAIPLLASFAVQLLLRKTPYPIIRKIVSLI